MTGLKPTVGALALAASVSIALAAQQPPSPQGPTFKSGTQIVSLFVTVADAQRRLVPGPHAGGFRGLRQRQAAADCVLPERNPADHRRRHARHQRQHDADARSAAGRRPNSSSSGCCPPTRAASARSTTRSSSARRSPTIAIELVTRSRRIWTTATARGLWDAVGASLDELKGDRRTPRHPGVHRRRRHGQQASGWER